MSKKDEIQESIIKKIVNNFRGIILVAVRVGKTRILLKSIQRHNKLENPKILVLYPNIDIKKSWERECAILGYFPNITYCTFISIDKVMEEDWDYIIVDEAHALPEENILPKVAELAMRHDNVILASGTFSSSTLRKIELTVEIRLIVNYPVEEAIEDGINANFNIVIHKYKLTNKEYWKSGKSGGKWKTSDLKELKRLNKKIETSEDTFLPAIARMRFINSCQSLIDTVNNWINSNKSERFILFTGDEKVGKNYNIPMYNSKSKTDDILRQFQKQEINQLCLIKKGQSGITFPYLQTILVTAINSNGENLEQMIGRSLLNDTEDATIHIFISTEPFQNKWMNKALENINPQKITVKN